MFFERFREAVARLPDGLLRPSAPASDAQIAAAEEQLGAPLPAAFASFLRSFDGADLFHEAIVIAGVGPDAPRTLMELNEDGGRELVFAEAVAGDRFAFDARGRVVRLRADSDDRVLAGSAFELWLDATVARERVLYGSDGEFAPDVFDDDGEEVVPLVVVRQMERALKVDPGSAEAEHERGVALRRLGKTARAVEAFTSATALDPDAAWVWFDLGRTALEAPSPGAGLDPAVALDAFRRAAALETGPAAARLHAWAARAAVAAGDEGAAAAAREAALKREPSLLDGLLRAEAEARHEGDEPARLESEALRLALAPASAPRRSLRVVDHREVEAPRPATPAARSAPPPPALPPRPSREGRPRSGASPRGRGPRR
jgi:tetratricopeptide (TPR) repeat protein